MLCKLMIEFYELLTFTFAKLNISGNNNPSPAGEDYEFINTRS